jgi:hypothetical protein
MHKIVFPRALLFFVIIFISGCSLTDVQVNELSNNSITYDESVFINNCGNNVSSEQLIKRTFDMKIEYRDVFSIAHQVYADEGVLEKYNQYQDLVTSIQLRASPNTNMQFIIRWSNEIHAGNVIIGDSTAKYEVRVPVAVDIVSSQNSGCGTTSLIPSETPNYAPTNDFNGTATFIPATNPTQTTIIPTMNNEPTTSLTATEASVGERINENLIESSGIITVAVIGLLGVLISGYLQYAAAKNKVGKK